LAKHEFSKLLGFDKEQVFNGLSKTTIYFCNDQVPICTF